MSQISPPIRILLVGAVVLAAAWVLILKPKDDTSTPAPAAAVTATPTGVARNPNGPAANTSLGRAVQKAEGASQTSDQTNSAINAASGGDDSTSTSAPSTSVPATQAAPAATTAPSTATDSTTKPSTTNSDATDGLPAWVDGALGHKVVAILFWDKSASDDRATHDAFKAALTPKADVVTRSVNIAKVADYGKVTRGVNVSQSPTLVLVDKDKDATALVGYSNLDSINQAIIDSRLATDDPSKSSPVGRKMDAACDVYRSSAMISTGDGTTSKDYKHELAGVSHALAATLKKAPKVSAAGPLKAQAGLLRKLVKSEQGVVGKIKSSALNGGAVDSTKIHAAQASNDKFEAKASLQLNAIGVTGCQ